MPCIWALRPHMAGNLLGKLGFGLWTACMPFSLRGALGRSTLKLWCQPQPGAGRREREVGHATLYSCSMLRDLRHGCGSPPARFPRRLAGLPLIPSKASHRCSLSLFLDEIRSLMPSVCVVCLALPLHDLNLS